MDDRGDDVGEDEDGDHRRDIHHAHSGDDAAERSKDRFRDGEEELGDWVAGADVGKPGKYGENGDDHSESPPEPFSQLEADHTNGADGDQ